MKKVTLVAFSTLVTAVLVYSWIDRPQQSGKAVGATIEHCVTYSNNVGRTGAASALKKWCILRIDSSKEETALMFKDAKEGQHMMLSVSERPSTGQRYYAVLNP